MLKKTWVQIILFLLILCAFCSIAYYASKYVTQAHNLAGLEVLQPIREPIRMRPEGSDNFKLPGSDKDIYNNFKYIKPKQAKKPEQKKGPFAILQEQNYNIIFGTFDNRKDALIKKVVLEEKVRKELPNMQLSIATGSGKYVIHSNYKHNYSMARNYCTKLKRKNIACEVSK